MSASRVSVNLLVTRQMRHETDETRSCRCPVSCVRVPVTPCVTSTDHHHNHQPILRDVKKYHQKLGRCDGRYCLHARCRDRHRHPRIAPPPRDAEIETLPIAPRLIPRRLVRVCQLSQFMVFNRAVNGTSRNFTVPGERS